MSFYDNDNTWSGQGRQASWEQGAPSAMAQQQSQMAEPNAFAAQFEEIERATDNLMRSGKWFPGAGAAPGTSTPGRRDSTPGMGPRFDNDSRGPRHHATNSEFDNRPGSSGLQGFYQGQRYPSRQSEAEQVLHAKRRMAAQRERELRNYHQEQQYNRNSSSAKSDRSMSPNTMSEEDRRDLIARQHRALYGDNSSLYSPDGTAPRPKAQDVRPSPTGRGSSPLAFDSFNDNQAQPGADANVQMAPRKDNAASPVGVETQQASRTNTASPGGTSPPLQSGTKSSVAPIGTRPVQAPPAGLNKRSATPLTPSSLNYGYSSVDGQQRSIKDERSGSSASNPALSGDKTAGLGSAWGSNSGVWSKNTLNSQASVWG